MFRRIRLLAVTAALAVVGVALGGGLAAAAPATPHLRASVTAANDFKRVCAAPRGRQVACTMLIRTNVRPRLQPADSPDAAPVGYGYGPSSLQSAYRLPSWTAGSGQTVAVVDPYDDPNAAADLAIYRAAWGLPACGTGCFEKVNENGQASPLPAAGNPYWANEESLDVDMVSAICPLCHILLVEASSGTFSDLGAAINATVGLGVKFISNSYYGAAGTYDAGYASAYLNHPGVAITFAGGDGGYGGPVFPASTEYVTAVGGTSLSPASNPRGWSETAWSGTGSGCSPYDPKPPWQTDTGCATRTANDVAADADPNTGVAYYDSYEQGGWAEAGGTSVATPIIASVYALAGPPAPGTYPSSYIYQHTSELYDVTSGSNGTCSPAYLCTAEVGYDGPTGWGTPDGTLAFVAQDVVTVTNPGSRDTYLDVPTSLQMSASSNDGDAISSYQATGLPPGLSINPATGLISGTPTVLGSYSVTVTATDAHGTQGSASFPWTVSPLPPPICGGANGSRGSPHICPRSGSRSPAE